MALGGINKMRVRQPRPWLGVLLVLLFLGHDLLMAVEATAAPAPGAGPTHHAMAVNGTPHAFTVTDGGDREHDHPGDCGVGQLLAPRIADETERSADIPSISPWSAESLDLLTHDEWPAVWQEPRWPADIQRALFQVYRI